MAAALPVALPALAALAALAVATTAVGAIGLGLSGRARTRSRAFLVDYGAFVAFGAVAVAGVWLFVTYDRGYVRPLLERYWLGALFAVFVLEGAMLLYFAPSESLVPAAVGLALTTDVAPATVEVYAAILATAVAGATLGQYLLFLLAKRWGRERLLERPWVRIGDERLARFEGWFETWGLLAVPVSNTLPFTRGMLTVPAGLAEMDDRAFVALSALGSLSFQAILALGALGIVRLGVL